MLRLLMVSAALAILMGGTSWAQEAYVKVSFIDLAVERVTPRPGQKVEMAGNLETLLSGTMVFLYNHEISTHSTSARISRQVVVTHLAPDARAYILEHCGGSSGCPATVRGSWSQYGGILADDIQF